MSRHGKAPAVHDITDVESDRHVGYRRKGRREYVKGEKGATTVWYVAPSLTVEYATAV